MEKGAAAHHQREIDQHRQSAEHQGNWLQIVLQHGNRLQEQTEQGRSTYAQLAAFLPVTRETCQQLQAAVGEVTCSLDPPCEAPACAAPRAVLCSCEVPLCIAVRHMAGMGCDLQHLSS